MANEELITNLRMQIDERLADSSVNELINQYEKLDENRQEFRDLRDKIRETIRAKIYEAYGEKTTIDKTFTVKEGDVFKYSSHSRANFSKIIDNLSMFEELTDEQREAFEEAHYEAKKSFDDKIDQTTRVLMNDDRDFDAATIKVKTGRIKLRLIDIDGSRSCSGERMQPLEEIRQKHVKELVKLMEYQPELLEVTEEMKARTLGAVETRKAHLRKVKEVSE